MPDYPLLLARLLFGSEMNASGDLVGRIAGFVMLCLALGCWPRAFKGEHRQALAPLLALSLLATVYLIYVGMGGVNVGVGQHMLNASSSPFDPLPPSAIQSSCVAVFLFDQLVRAQQD